ncbi:MAG: M50 family metallopeptidase [Anaerolineales bacterium]
MFSIQLVQFILGIAALILLHELGHFIAARLLNVEVEEFGIGFPPRIVKLFEYKGTAYSLNWLPLGGFVRPKGENDPDVPGGLAAASPWVRLGVLFAGPAMNLLIGVILGIILFYSLGDPIQDKVITNYIDPGTPAAEAGMQAGDLFIAVNGQEIDSTAKLQELISQNLGTPTEIEYQRGDQIFVVTLTPRAEWPEGQGPMGIGITNPTQPVNVGTAIRRGAEATFGYVRALLLLPVRLLQGQASPQEGRLLGYKGMFDIYRSLQSPLWFFMAISISLGIINLFPIPALDGGRIMLTLPEILIRRRIPAQYENMIHMVGFALLIMLLIYINLQDFLNPIQLP